jgi:hypothetical protein
MRRLLQFFFKRKDIVYQEDNNDEYICTALYLYVCGEIIVSLKLFVLIFG